MYTRLRRNVYSFLTLAVFAAAHGGLLAGPRAFTVEDLYRLRAVEEPTVSPDGRMVVYKLTTSDLKTMERTSHLWCVDLEGQNARALTFGAVRDSSPVFSPDGKSVAFVSTRSGEAQLWVLPLSGGDPVRKTDFPGGIAGPVFSPDGRRVAVTADVDPACGADAACNRRLADTRERSKLKAHLADRLLYRHWDSWKDGKRTHILLVDLESGRVDDVTPGDFDSPTFSLGGKKGYAFSPDGLELAFTSNRDRDEASSTNSDLFFVATNSSSSSAVANPTRLTPNPAWDGTPSYSPDGRYIAYRTQKVPGYEADRFRIALYDRRNRTSQVVTESFDNTIGDFEWSADSGKILFTADVKGRTPLHELDLATRKIRTVSNVGFIDAFALSNHRSFAVVSRRRVASPQELYRVSLEGTEGSAPDLRLTKHNAAIEAEADLRPVEEIFLPGSGGTPIQVFLVKPHGFVEGKRYPLILNIHGGPQSQWADSFRGDFQVYPGAGYIVAFLNPHGSTGFGQAFTSAISGDWNGRVMEDIDRVSEALGRLPFVDKDRMGAMGWSWGGYAVMWLQGHSKRFKALASMMGVYDLRSMYSATEELWFPTWDLKGAPWESREGRERYRLASPSEYVTAFQTPCLVVTGQRDFRVPYSQSLMYFTDLQKRGVPSRLLVFENAGHWPAWYEMSLYYLAHLDWFHRYLGGDAPPWDPAELARGTLFGN